MKILLAIVSMIAVFTADGRNFRNEPGVQNTPNESKLFPDGVEGSDSAKPPFNIPGDQNSAEEGQKSPGGPEIQNISDPVYEDHQMKVETKQHERKVKKSSCKAKITCDIVGGFCVNNTKLCSGRLVPGGCKGKCQCCILGTLELKIESYEMELQSLKINLTENNVELKMAIQALNKNNTEGITDLKMELQTLKSNLTDNNVELKTTMQDLNKNNTESITDLKMELQSMKSNLTGNNVELIMVIQAINKNITEAITDLKMEIQSMKSNISHNNSACHEDFIKSNGSRKCYKTFRDKTRSWSEAKIKCQEAGLILARPSKEAAISLRKDILDKDGQGRNWLDARGDGSTFRWQYDGSELRTDNSAWHPGRPGSCVTTSCCLSLQVYTYESQNYPNQPYIDTACTRKFYTLCEEE